MERLDAYRDRLKDKRVEEVLSWIVSELGPGNTVLASSFGAEDQVLTHMISVSRLPIRMMTLDTGRIFQETYDTMQRSMTRYGIRYELYAPAADEVAKMVFEHGPNLFYESLEKRRLCCEIRKLRPLSAALRTVDAWICGIRRDQAVTRGEAKVVEWDETHRKMKFSPLFSWTEEEVWRYIRDHRVPYNALHDKGFRSIGCAPCTRAIGKDEDIRAGRWWWESPEHKECGLHRSH